MRPTTFAVALAAAISVPVVMADTKVDWDADVSHDRYRTFDAREGTPLSNPLAMLRIRQAIASYLVHRGLAEDDEAPDVVVVVHASVTPDRPLNLDGYGERSNAWSTPLADLGEIDAGTLVVDLVDPETGVLVWRAVATGAVTNNPTKNRKKIDKVIARMFRRFPPEPPRK